ncbi:uncharacterized protein HD556DRAFT_292300 [Suillus plorans]|uniref:Uncharacterized protein n=1 Tax=Suillus plorans TaxID=116603 RepID=A0A9P7AWD3_9AGAM|nr:uncharacterized protein HD556DRAFT_292300 [Suillus plorans]KAG1796284.1 hypothetical protein HD556DRAFT_292300 [Suillus plorans]
MSYLTSVRNSLKRTLGAPSRYASARCANKADTLSSRRYDDGRRYTSTMHDNDPETLEREKRRNLSGTQLETSANDDAPGWNENLASESEAHVKADRSSVTFNDLQRKTIDFVNAKHQADERMDHREASYLKDEVTGPLGTARVGEFEGVVGAGDLGIDQEGTDIDSDGRTIKRHIVYEETIEVVREPCPTESEADVKADRGEYS